MATAVQRVMSLANKALAGLYRGSRGRLLGSMRGTPILVLTVPGRRSGQPRSTPVGYFPYQDGWLVVGSAGGMPQEPDWFKNLRKAERATVQIGARVIEVTCEVLGEPMRTELYREVIVKKSPGFAGYEKKTDRVIPIALLRPKA
jgi:deazaflavin-dependent oxidoreductase (nitroreductase family)